MLRFNSRWRSALVLFCLTVVSAGSVAPAHAESPVKLQTAVIMVDDMEAPLSPLTIEGTVSHLGRITGDGEISFGEGEEWGISEGVGVVGLVAANGDHLAGIITIEVYPFEDGEADAEIHISWRDSVTFADGSVFRSTGRFAKSRPPGVIALAIGSHQWITQPLCFTTR
jgi:hypothetical protein